MSLASARKAPTPRSGLFLCPLPSAVSGAGPCRTGWTARGNRRLRGFGQIRGRLPPTGLPGGRSPRARRGAQGDTKHDEEGRDNHNEHKGSEARRKGEARAVGSGQRAKPAERPAEPASLPRTLASLRSNPPSLQASKPPNFQASPSARKPPAHPCVFAVKSPKPPSLQTSKPPPLPASLPRHLASLRSNLPSLQASKLPSLLLCPQASRAPLRLCGLFPLSLLSPLPPSAPNIPEPCR